MDEAIRQAEERIEFVATDADSMRAYFNHLMFLPDMTSYKNTARREGLAEGRAEGRTEGLAEGLAEGRAEANLEIARKMKARGRPLEEIAEDTGLSQEVIETL